MTGSKTLRISSTGWPGYRRVTRWSWIPRILSFPPQRWFNIRIAPMLLIRPRSYAGLWTLI